VNQLTTTASYRRGIFGIAIIFMSLGWTSGGALAQNAGPDVLPSTAPSTLWLLEGPQSNPAPHLVVGMVDREDRSRGSSFSLTGRGTMLPATENAARQINRAISANPAKSTNPAKNDTSKLVVLSSLSDLSNGPQDSADLRSEPTSARSAVQRSSNRNPKMEGLLDDTSAAGSFLATDRMREVLSKQWLESDEYFASAGQYDSSPLAQFKLGDWQFPVALSTAANSE
jgi:hypothetical protein